MEKEFQPFKLLPPCPYIDEWSESGRLKSMDNYLNILFNDVKEEGGKSTFFSFITQTRDYRKSKKIDYVKDLFKGIFSSFRELREALKEGGLENTAKAIKMQAPNNYGFGKITYVAPNQNKGDFAFYELR